MSHRILIGFSTKSSAVCPRFFCKRFKHCIVVADNILIQIATNGIRLFSVRAAEIHKLEKAGWVFIKTKNEKLITKNLPVQFLTCVGFAKRAAGIHNPFIWTPDQLFRKLADQSKI